MLDTVDDPAVGLPREEKRVTHKKAARMAIEFLERRRSQAGGHRRNRCRRAPNGVQQASTQRTTEKADPKKFLLLRRGRA